MRFPFFILLLVVFAGCNNSPKATDQTINTQDSVSSQNNTEEEEDSDLINTLKDLPLPAGR